MNFGSQRREPSSKQEPALGRARVPAGRIMGFIQPTGLPERRRPVHQMPWDRGNRSIIVFLPVCVRNRQPLLANPVRHETIRQCWQKADAWLVGRYVIMPDHLHSFCAPATYPTESLLSWVSYWKRRVAYAAGGSFWQRNFWDTQLRQSDSYAAKWEYERNNPVRAGLSRSPDDWPYQGELNVLRWHD